MLLFISTSGISNTVIFQPGSFEVGKFLIFVFQFRKNNPRAFKPTSGAMQSRSADITTQ
jgi:hypothetical protein